MPATPVEGPELNPALPQPRGRLARVSLKIAPTDHGRNAIEESRKGHSVGNQDELLIFLDHKEVPSDNTGEERAIRPAVLIRKKIFANGSEAGAHTQAIFMTIMRTLKMKGHNSAQVLSDALKKHVRSAQLPPLPQKITA